MNELALPWFIFPLFFLVAFFYAMVGHGGASGYLALFALLGMARPDVAPVALSLNVVVATTGFINYYRGGHFRGELLLPFVIASIPAAFIGAWIPISGRLFSLLLGIALFFAALRIFLRGKFIEKPLKSISRQIWYLGIPIGLVLGFFSGLIGIGGGIFL
ncbi:MAG: sulfite exporter TauE/SafE family protein, partial [Calditrichia bacterium]